MNSLTVRRAVINLGDIELDVFQMPDGSYQLSEEGTASAVGKPNNSVLYFRRSKAPQALPYKDFAPYKSSVEGENTRINCIPFDLAAAYWLKETIAGNTEAAILLGAFAVEGLERRADKVFSIEKSEEQRNVDFADFLERWRRPRNHAKAAHGLFIAAYTRLKHPRNHVHDLLTTLIFGETAAQARKKDLVDPEGDESIGLDHQEDMHKMMILADVKTKYFWLKDKEDETWQERITRAFDAVNNAK